jgi:hypothetical protein
LKSYDTILKKKKSDPDDPFDGLHFVGIFGLPVARYAYKVVDETQKEIKDKPKKEDD